MTLFHMGLEFFLYMQRELKLSVPAIKGYRAALNHVFTLAGTNLIANKVISRKFYSFKKSCLPKKITPTEWNLSLVLKSLTCLSYELMEQTWMNI